VGFHDDVLSASCARTQVEEVRRAAAEVLAAQGLLYGQAGGLTLADAEGGALSLVDDTSEGSGKPRSAG
jgi:hypothetical protein